MHRLDVERLTPHPPARSVPERLPAFTKEVAVTVTFCDGCTAGIPVLWNLTDIEHSHVWSQLVIEATQPMSGISRCVLKFAGIATACTPASVRELAPRLTG